jgi:AcrR family transcriptional regulator
MNSRLGKQEWIIAGLKALTRGGVDGVRIERLAKDLGVTKGSFYWHFKDRDQLLMALLDAWKSLATTDIIAEVDALGQDAAARLRSLFMIVLQSDGRLDTAIRNWSAKDAKAQAVQADVDERRLDYVRSLFAELGFPAAEALARARLVYHALIGEFSIGLKAPQDARLDELMKIILPMLTRF